MYPNQRCSWLWIPAFAGMSGECEDRPSKRSPDGAKRNPGFSIPSRFRPRISLRSMRATSQLHPLGRPREGGDPYAETSQAKLSSALNQQRAVVMGPRLRGGDEEFLLGPKIPLDILPT